MPQGDIRGLLFWGLPTHMTINILQPDTSNRCIFISTFGIVTGDFFASLACLSLANKHLLSSEPYQSYGYMACRLLSPSTLRLFES